MHPIISFDQMMIPAERAEILALSSSALYGKGVFTTIAIYNGAPFLWNKHWQRIGHNAAKLGIDISEHSDQKTKEAFETLLAKNHVGIGRVRITFFDERPSGIWPFGSEKKTSLLITTGDLRPVPENFRLTVSPYPVNSLSPLAGVKSCNYLENILALDEAKARGFDEAIRVNERGEVTSALMANVFWLKNDVLYTPSLKTGCLAGTTREFVLENLVAREVEATIDDLKTADAIFLTSAGLGVVPTAEFESRRFNLPDHAITRLLPLTR